MKICRTCSLAFETTVRMAEAEALIHEERFPKHRVVDDFEGEVEK